MKDRYRPGDHLALCDRCGFEYYASQLRKTWDGLLVCDKDWEPRHPQDFVRGRPDRQAVADARPEPDPVFLTTNQVQPEDL